MKEWFIRNERTISRWMYGIGLASFIVTIVLTIALGRYGEALAWSCALIWLNRSQSWYELVRKQDALLDSLLDKLFKKKEGEGNGSK